MGGEEGARQVTWRRSRARRARLTRGTRSPCVGRGTTGGFEQRATRSDISFKRPFLTVTRCIEFQETRVSLPPTVPVVGDDNTTGAGW